MGLFRSPKVSDEIPDINRREAMRQFPKSLLRDVVYCLNVLFSPRR